jgi:hypothetical protein
MLAMSPMMVSWSTSTKVGLSWPITGIDLRGTYQGCQIDVALWSGEGDGGEIESKDGFKEHHGAHSSQRS